MREKIKNPHKTAGTKFSIDWDLGRLGNFVYFIVIAAAIALFIWLVNTSIELFEYMPDEKIRGSILFVLLIIGIALFID